VQEHPGEGLLGTAERVQEHPGEGLLGTVEGRSIRVTSGKKLQAEQPEAHSPVSA
jgi:hypothetical protein